MTQQVTLILSWMVVGGQALVVILAGLLIWVHGFGKRKGKARKLLSFAGKYGLQIGLLVSATSTLGSLYYSEVAGFTPWKLCWIQRIFMYPQFLLFGMAVWRDDKEIGDYALALSVIGAGFAAYHYFLQRSPDVIVPCSVVGFSLGCSQQFVMSLGYITIPLMALTGFLMIKTLILSR